MTTKVATLVGALTTAIIFAVSIVLIGREWVVLGSAAAIIGGIAMRAYLISKVSERKSDAH
jgi:hypothetical protein